MDRLNKLYEYKDKYLQELVLIDENIEALKQKKLFTEAKVSVVSDMICDEEEIVEDTDLAEEVAEQKVEE